MWRPLIASSLILMSLACENRVSRPIIASKPLAGGSQDDKDSIGSKVPADGTSPDNGSKDPVGSEPIVDTSPKPDPAIDLPPPVIEKIANPHNENALRLLDRLSQTTRLMVGQDENDKSDPTAWSRLFRRMSNRSPAIVSVTLDSPTEDAKSWSAFIAKATALSQKGVVVAVSWMPCAPRTPTLCDATREMGLSDTEWKELLTKDSALQKSFQTTLSTLATHLSALKDMPLIFRPLPELDGAKYWWGGHVGAMGSAYLYEYIRHYLVKEKGLTNLVFALDFGDREGNPEFKVADSIWDIAAMTMTQDQGLSRESLSRMQAVSGQKPVSAFQLSKLPSRQEMDSLSSGWSFVVTAGAGLSKNHGLKTISEFYTSDKVLTLNANAK